MLKAMKQRVWWVQSPGLLYSVKHINDMYAPVALQKLWAI